MGMSQRPQPSMMSGGVMGGMSMQPQAGPNNLNQSVLELIRSGQQAQLQANQANMDRYNSILDGYMRRYDKGMELADVRANQAYRHMAGDAAQQMVNRGLHTSTVAARKMFDAFESSRQIPLAQHNATSGDALAFAERRNDVGPDMGQLMQLAQMAGQSQSGIAGQSSPLSSGTNIGSYPGGFGVMQGQTQNRQAPQMFAPRFTGTFNPFPAMAARGVYGASAGIPGSRRSYATRLCCRLQAASFWSKSKWQIISRSRKPIRQ